jgi:hypothetical protein
MYACFRLRQPADAMRPRTTVCIGGIPAVRTHFFSADTVKVVNGGLTSRRGLPTTITGSCATTVIPALAQQIGPFGRRFTRETACATTLFPAPSWLHMVDTRWGDGRTST